MLRYHQQGEVQSYVLYQPSIFTTMLTLNYLSEFDQRALDVEQWTQIEC